MSDPSGGPRVLITDPIDAEGVAYLRDRGIEVVEDTEVAGEALAELLAGFDGLIVRSGTQVTADVLRPGRLRAIGRAGVGVNNIDVEAATRLGVAVMNTPTGNITSATEHTLALLLSMARKIPAADRSIKEGRWERKRFTGVELEGKTLAIVGLGRIGSRVASRARAFGMEVLAFDPYLSDKRAAELSVAPYADIDQMLPLADFVTVHVPLNDATRGLFDLDRLRRLKAGARIVNCSRGGVIDEAALATVLDEGHLAGAAIDVFASEPPEEGNPLTGREDVVTTPHLGASTVEAQKNVGLSIAEQVADGLLTGVFRQAVNLPVEDWAAFERLRPVLLLAERLGSFAAQFAQAPVEGVEVEFAGEFEETSTIRTAVVSGLIEAMVGDRVNYVNANLLAAERGIRIGHSRLPGHDLYRRLVRVRLATAEGAHVIGGTLVHDRSPRLVELDDYEVDLEPSGTVLVFENDDRPGVIGSVGTILGAVGCNIAQFSLGRRSEGGVAIAALNLDGPATPEILTALRGVANMRWVRQIVL